MGKKKPASWNSAHSAELTWQHLVIGRLPCPHSVEVCSSLPSLLAFRPQRSRNRKATRAAGLRAAWHQQMTPAAGPPMALSQILTPPQPATPTVLPTIAPALLLDQNRPEVRNQLRQRRRRRSSNLVPSLRHSPCNPAHPWLTRGLLLLAGGAPTLLWGGADLEGRKSHSKRGTGCRIREGCPQLRLNSLAPRGATFNAERILLRGDRLAQ
jgi:hypothetical protein